MITFLIKVFIKKRLYLLLSCKGYKISKEKEWFILLGEKLKSLRKSRGLTQDDIAAKFDLSRGSISNWEKGRRKPSIKQLEVLANFYNVSLDYFADESKTDEVVDLLERAKNLLKDNSIPTSNKEELYQEIMRLYLELKNTSK